MKPENVDIIRQVVADEIRLLRTDIVAQLINLRKPAPLAIAPFCLVLEAAGFPPADQTLGAIMDALRALCRSREDLAAENHRLTQQLGVLRARAALKQRVELDPDLPPAWQRLAATEAEDNT